MARNELLIFVKFKVNFSKDQEGVDRINQSKIKVEENLGISNHQIKIIELSWHSSAKKAYNKHLKIYSPLQIFFPLTKCLLSIENIKFIGCDNIKCCWRFYFK